MLFYKRLANVYYNNTIYNYVALRTYQFGTYNEMHLNVFNYIGTTSSNDTKEECIYIHLHIGS